MHTVYCRAIEHPPYMHCAFLQNMNRTFLKSCTQKSTGQKFGHITIFNVFKHRISFSHQAFIYFIKNTEQNSNIVQYYYRYFNLK